MKKGLWALAGFLLLLVSFIYLFIPNSIAVKAYVVINIPGTAIHRMLLNTENRTKWWPGKIVNDQFSVNGYNYNIGNGNITVMPVNISSQNVELTTSLFLTSVVTDSTQVQWIGSITSSYNPVKRVKQFLQAKKISEDMAGILKRMQVFYSQQINVYGFEIEKTILTDTLFIATAATCQEYPTIAFVYAMVEKLRSYATSHAAKENGYPMLNVFTADGSRYDVKVALPVDKALPVNGDILQKRMPASGKMLMIQVKGGVAINIRAFEQIQIYADDYQRKSPAICYYSLITDRLKEQDSTRWITRVFLPVM
jgi:hypothetical protein